MIIKKDQIIGILLLILTKLQFGILAWYAIDSYQENHLVFSFILALFLLLERVVQYLSPYNIKKGFNIQKPIFFLLVLLHLEDIGLILFARYNVINRKMNIMDRCRLIELLYVPIVLTSIIYAYIQSHYQSNKILLLFFPLHSFVSIFHLKEYEVDFSNHNINQNKNHALMKFQKETILTLIRSYSFIVSWMILTDIPYSLYYLITIYTLCITYALRTLYSTFRIKDFENIFYFIQVFFLIHIDVRKLEDYSDKKVFDQYKQKGIQRGNVFLKIYLAQYSMLSVRLIYHVYQKQDLQLSSYFLLIILMNIFSFVNIIINFYKFQIKQLIYGKDFLFVSDETQLHKLNSNFNDKYYDSLKIVYIENGQYKKFQIHFSLLINFKNSQVIFENQDSRVMKDQDKSKQKISMKRLNYDILKMFLTKKHTIVKQVDEIFVQEIDLLNFVQIASLLLEYDYLNILLSSVTDKPFDASQIHSFYVNTFRKISAQLIVFQQKVKPFLLNNPYEVFYDLNQEIVYS